MKIFQRWRWLCYYQLDAQPSVTFSSDELKRSAWPLFQFFLLTPSLNVSERKNASVRRALFHKCLFRRTTPFLDRRHINMYHVSPVYLYFTFFSSKTFRASPHLQLHLNSANVFVFNWQFYKVSETCFLQGPNSVARHNVVCSSFVKDCSSDWMFWQKINFQIL